MGEWRYVITGAAAGAAFTLFGLISLNALSSAAADETPAVDTVDAETVDAEDLSQVAERTPQQTAGGAD